MILEKTQILKVSPTLSESDDEEKLQFAAFLDRAIRNMGGDPWHHKEEDSK